MAHGSSGAASGSQNSVSNEGLFLHEVPTGNLLLAGKARARAKQPDASTAALMHIAWPLSLYTYVLNYTTVKLPDNLQARILIRAVHRDV